MYFINGPPVFSILGHARFFLQGVEAIVWMFPSCADMGEAAAAAGEEPRDEDNAALLRAFFLSVSRFLVRANGSSTPLPARPPRFVRLPRSHCA